MIRNALWERVLVNSDPSSFGSWGRKRIMALLDVDYEIWGPPLIEFELIFYNFRSATHSTASWLSISLDAALGCRTNVFQVHRTGSSAKKSGTCSTSVNTVTIHPQASPLVCRHVLDTLIALAKSFPNHFLPDAHQPFFKEETPFSTPQTPTTSKSPTDFWDVLVKLDSSSNSRKGKSVLKAQRNALLSLHFSIHY